MTFHKQGTRGEVKEDLPALFHGWIRRFDIIAETAPRNHFRGGDKVRVIVVHERVHLWRNSFLAQCVLDSKLGSDAGFLKRTFLQIGLLGLELEHPKALTVPRKDHTTKTTSGQVPDEFPRVVLGI
jgi:hypothetical protein